MDSLVHITLNTGHRRQSPRSEATQLAVDSVAVELSRALRDGETSILLGNLTDAPPHYRLKASAVGSALLCTVFAPIGAPLVTFGIAKRSLHSAKLWELLHKTIDHAETSAERPPPTPWLGVRIEPTIALDLSAMSWLGDYERIVAWAWIERRGGGRRA
ncbi:hypothetical protein GCM10011390_20870 [Aureimonas endophytica]|uniref:Uncharacterized protein n=1 Tax=Aureimonas endophytica TaxID=2027858 RepID=A0A916ZL56_9HYPH|nr:hypothetical protein [Aureimonas endophytica]GGE01859.1 hypothetical protein GCM10011390_20870 [Aureimonas endophytica]